jgi:hypothetical protein
MEVRDSHRKFAVECFNRVWELLEKTDRTDQECDEMIHAAHASRYHWGVVGEPVNFARGDWQISRVYAVLGRPESALYHGERCLAVCRAHEVDDFDLAFAHEALARAYAAAGDAERSSEYFTQAEQLGSEIRDADDRDAYFAELRSGPWFGLPCGPG